MTNIQKAFCVVLSLIFLCVVAALPGDFFKHGEIYRQLPLYCFLEKKALQEENGQDRETEMLLQEKNAEHLGEEVEAENRKEQEALLLAEAEKAEEKESPESVQKPSDSAETKKTDGKQKENVEKKDEIKKETSQKKEKTPEITKPEDTPSESTPTKAAPKEKKTSGEEAGKTQETVALPHPQIDLSPAKLADFDYVMNQFFILDSNTETNAQQIPERRSFHKTGPGGATDPDLSHPFPGNVCRLQRRTGGRYHRWSGRPSRGAA